MFKEAVSPLQMGWTWLNGSNMLSYLQKRSRRGWCHCLFLFSDPLAIASESDCPSPLCGFSRSLHPLLILPCCHKTQAFAAFLLNSSIGQPMDDRPQLGRLSTRNRLKRGSKPLGPSWRDPVEILDVDDIQWFTYIGSYVEVIWYDIHVYIYILYLFKIKQYNTPEYLCVDHLSWTVAASWQGNANIDWQHVWTYLRPWCMMLHMIDFPCGFLRPQIH